MTVSGRALATMPYAPGAARSRRCAWTEFLLAMAFFAAAVSFPVNAAPEREPMKMGFYLPAIRDANMTDVKVSLGIWIDEIAKPYGVKVTSSLYEDMPSIREAVIQGDVNFISAPGMELAEVFAPADLRQGYANHHIGSEEGLALVVPRAANIRSVADLRDKRVARIGKHHAYEYFLEVQCLKASGLECKDYLKIIEEKRDIQSLYDVFFGRADAALVSLPTLRMAAEMNPQVSQKLTVILDWKVKGLVFGMMTKYTDPEYRDIIVNTVQEAITKPRARQILEVFKTSSLVPADADDLMPFRALLREYKDLLKTRKPSRQQSRKEAKS